MSDLFWLSDAQMARLERYFPKSHGKPRIHDRRVLSGIIFIYRNVLSWRDAPKEYRPHRTLNNRWKRWSDKGVFARIIVGTGSRSLREKDGDDRRYLPESTSHSVQPAPEKGEPGRLIGRTKGGMTTKLHAICDSQGPPYQLRAVNGSQCVLAEQQLRQQSRPLSLALIQAAFGLDPTLATWTSY